jgi:hypothetical protein
MYTCLFLCLRAGCHDDSVQRQDEPLLQVKMRSIFLKVPTITKLENLIALLMAHEFSIHFREPLDPEALGLLKYVFANFIPGLVFDSPDKKKSAGMMKLLNDEWTSGQLQNFAGRKRSTLSAPLLMYDLSFKIVLCTTQMVQQFRAWPNFFRRCKYRTFIE